MQQEEIYPAGQNSSAARQVQTNPIKGGGASFCTHRLVETTLDRIEFKAAPGAIIFYLIFLLMGIGAAVFCVRNALSGKHPFLSADIIMPGLIGTIFATIGGCMLYFGTAPIGFDKRNDYFWKGRKSPDAVFNIDQIKTWTKLEKIKSLQLVSEECSGSKGRRYRSYELNLVLDDGKRINVVDHGGLTRIRNDSEKLSAFLGKPLTDLAQR
jgi:uncharacterized integral membrane protein